MVSNPGGTPDTRRIRRLKAPQAIEVEAGTAGLPLCLRLDAGWQPVSLTREPWRIDQHWWRGPGVSRLYYRVAPEDGPPLTIYHDLVADAWFRQEY